MDLEGKFAEGVSGRMHTPQGRTHEVSFHNIEEGKSYEMETTVIPGTRFHFKCEVSPSDSGSTISQTVRISGPLAFLLAPLAGPGMAKSFDKVLDGLKQKVETSDRP
jgi:Polyketide cyclase / dehydrase and lipid transport